MSEAVSAALPLSAEQGLPGDLSLKQTDPTVQLPVTVALHNPVHFNHLLF